MIPVPLLGAFLAYQFHHATHMDGDWRVDGFPLPIAIFERVPGGWRDYPGWMTPIAYCGNPVIGLLIPLIPEAFATLIPKKRKPAA